MRAVLIVDAAVSGASGLLMLLAAEPLASLLGVPTLLLRYAGASLIPFAALVLILSRRGHIPSAGVWSVIAANAAWVVTSILVLFTGVITPNVWGWTFILVQAVAVAGFAEMQYAGLRRRILAAG